MDSAHPPSANDQAIGVGSAQLVPLQLGGAAASKKKKPDSSVVSVAGITRVAFLAEGKLASAAGGLPFEDVRGRSVCWRLGRVSAADFAADSGAVGMNDRLFHSSRVKIFFPIGTQYFAVRSVTINGAPTTARVLRAIETTAHMATAYHLKRDLGRQKPTLGDVREALSGAVICHLMCQRVGGGNHVYVRLT
jgi:hypothetical protein